MSDDATGDRGFAFLADERLKRISELEAELKQAREDSTENADAADRAYKRAEKAERDRDVALLDRGIEAERAREAEQRVRELEAELATQSEIFADLCADYAALKASHAGKVRKYFSYDPEDGFEEHATSEAAKNRAAYGLEAARDIASDSEWEMSGVDGICWGIVLGETQVIETREAPEGSRVDYYEDYGLVELVALDTPADEKGGTPEALAEEVREMRREFRERLKDMWYIHGERKPTPAPTPDLCECGHGRRMRSALHDAHIALQRADREIEQLLKGE